MKNNPAELEQAMLLAWQKGRDAARAGQPPKPDAILALLPTWDEADAYRAGYQQERKRLDRNAVKR